MQAADLAEVLATFGPAYLATRPLPRGGAKVWRAILACRTAVLGGHIDTCDCCGRTRHVYHSCRNRHCPRCQTRAKEAWVVESVAEFLRRVTRLEYERCPQCRIGQFRLVATIRPQRHAPTSRGPP
ncbi:MAG: transposase zinc-binding domain-containing protein [Candidatus Binatia bacterium]|nr:transposase zinc-binding domain-containing protein [Candidatus Binatia bacterium]